MRSIRTTDLQRKLPLAQLPSSTRNRDPMRIGQLLTTHRDHLSMEQLVAARDAERQKIVERARQQRRKRQRSV